MAEETSDDNYRVCPYCKYEHYVEDWHEKPTDTECSQCEKKFWAWDEPRYTFHAEPDCKLNGETCVPKNPKAADYTFCVNCNQLIDLTKDERDKI